LRKQGPHTLLRFRRIGDEFGFVILLRDREQLLHLNRSELGAPLRNPICDGDVIAEVENQKRRSGDEKHARPGHLTYFSAFTAASNWLSIA